MNVDFVKACDVIGDSKVCDHEYEHDNKKRKMSDDINIERKKRIVIAKGVSVFKIHHH
jgi:hypothetical protein